MDKIDHKRCAKLYDDINVYNRNQIYYGCGDVADAGKFSNKVGSVELPTRTCTTLHSQKNFTGDVKILCNYSYERNKIFQRIGDMNNKMNSMRVFDLQQD